MSVRSCKGSSVLRSLVLLCATFTTGSLFAQTFITLHSFGGTADGQNPQGGLVRDSAGNLRSELGPPHASLRSLLRS